MTTTEKKPRTLSLDDATWDHMVEMAMIAGVERGRPMSVSEWVRIMVAREYERQ